jgi:mRNA interferase MazF
MEKDLDKWNERKKKLDEQSRKQRPIFANEREVWMCSIGHNVGHEENGKGKKFARPVVVVRRFNKHSLWVVPLSSQQKDYDFYYNFTDREGNQIAAIISQLKLVSSARLLRRMYRVEKSQFAEIKDQIVEQLKLN